MTVHNNDRFDENLKRMFASAFDQPRPGFQERLVGDVLDEVARERRRQAAPPWWSRWLVRPQTVPGRLAAASALVAVLLSALWFGGTFSPGAIAQVRCLYGLVTVQNNGVAQTISEPLDLRSGQRIKTQAGSKAQIRLLDRSLLTSEPRTALQIARLPQGPRIRLEQGSLNLDAAKQPPGQAITIEAAQARVKVLGTRLDVRLVEKPSGVRQTRVRVLSGSVELESGGQKLQLPAGTEGVADEGQPPVRSTLVAEINELNRLLDETRARSARSGQRQGLPAIIDLTAATLWTVIPTPASRTADLGFLNLKLKYPAFRVQAFTLEGLEIPATGNGQTLRLDFSKLASATLTDLFILRIPGVGGWLQAVADGGFACRLPGNEGDLPTLVQFQLPANARVDHLSPAAVETRIEYNKLILTLAAQMRLPQLYE